MSISTAGSSREDPAGSVPVPAAASVPAASSRAHSDHAWVWYVSLLSLGLGAMLALAVRTTAHIRNSGLTGTRLGISPALLSTIKEENVRQQHTIEDLRKTIRDYENNITNQDKSVGLLKKQFDELRAMTGMAPVEGPGLKITLKDSQETRLPNLGPGEEASYQVHDQDLNGLLEELKASGAEALAIAGADGKSMQRVVVTTTARCVGSTAVVNGVYLSAPYTILAIGSPKNLKSALLMRDGFVQMRALDVLKMIDIEESDHLVLPEYTGSFSPKYARPAPPKS